MFRVFAWLVSAGILDSVTIHRMPVGHTHSHVDALFSILSRHLFGTKGLPAGANARTPQELMQQIAAAYIQNPPSIAWAYSWWDFARWLEPHGLPLAGYGPSREWVEGPGGGPATQQEHRTSNLLMAKIACRPGEPFARIQFFQADGAVKAWGGPNGEGVQLLKSMPEGAPELVTFSATTWRGANGSNPMAEYLSALRAIGRDHDQQFGPAQQVESSSLAEDICTVIAGQSFREATPRAGADDVFPRGLRPRMCLCREGTRRTLLRRQERCSDGRGAVLIALHVFEGLLFQS